MSVVITGIGMIGSLGATRGAAWELARSGRPRMQRLAGPAASVRGLADVVVAPVDDAALEQELRGLDARGVDRPRRGRTRQLALVAADAALVDAGLEGDAASAGRGAVVMGAVASGAEEVERIALGAHAGDRPRVSDNLGKRAAVAVQDVVRRAEATGPAFAVDAACASGAVALAHGRRLIASGDADWCLAGGVEASLTASHLVASRSIGALSTRYADAPDRASRPFDADRDGFVPAEGACFLLLENADRAARRGATVYAALAAAAEGVDPTHPTQLEQAFVERLMREALDRAGLAPERIDWVKAHATGTPQGDAAEAHAIAAVFGGPGDASVGVWAPKSTVGHLMAAAGATESALAALALREGLVPPTANLDRLGDDCPIRVLTEPTPCDASAVLANSFGFGGAGVCLVLQKK